MMTQSLRAYTKANLFPLSDMYQPEQHYRKKLPGPANETNIPKSDTGDRLARR